MATLYVRDFPEELHKRVRALAARRCRSLSAEVVALMEQALEQEELQARRSEALSNIARRRSLYSLPPQAKRTTDMIHEDRSR